jgi:hypothetical protein
MQEEKIFRIARLSAENDDVTIAVGNYRVTNKVFKSEAQAQRYINTKPWELIAALASLYVEFAIKKDAIIESENTNNESKEG